jgi:hypothetical protein
LTNKKPTKRTKQKPEGYRKSVYLGLKARDLENVEKVVAIMRSDPVAGLMDDKIGRAKAARYALAYCAKHHPAAHATTG